MPKNSVEAAGKPRGLDVRPDRVDFRDRSYRPPLTALPDQHPSDQLINSYLPAYLEDGMVLDQGTEGACTGFGLAAVINYIYWETYKTSQWYAAEAEKRKEAYIPPVLPKPKRVSERMLYNNARLYDEWDGEDYEGSSCRGAMKGWHKHGICSADLFPYTNDHFDRPHKGWEIDAAERPLGAYYRVERMSRADLQAAIYETHAVYASAKVHDGWKLEEVGSLDDAVINQAGYKVTGGHAFALVGYTRKGFIVQNSWGGNWGFKGFGLLPYDDWARNGYDAWVAAIGAPVDQTAGFEAPQSKVKMSLVARAGLADADPLEAASAKPHGPWSETKAYRHALVTGNDGQLLRRLADAEDAADNLKLIFQEAQERIKTRKLKHLVMFAHGGVVSEEWGLQYARQLGPHFEANRIYPIFFVWKTGIVESLRNIGADQLQSIKEQFDHLRAEGLGRELLDTFREVRDRSFELVARQIAGRAIWSQIKQNAQAAAAGQGGIRLVTHQLRELRNDCPDLKIHLAGHSAGSIWLGHLLDDMRQSRLGNRKDPPIKSCTLWAPACTMAFANQYYGQSFEHGLVNPKGFHLDILNDAYERDDHVILDGLYSKSILYLVSRALEDVHKTPLLGLERATTGAWEAARAEDFFAAESEAELKAWDAIKKKYKLANPNILKGQDPSTAQHIVPPSHTTFDNDPHINNALLRRILGRKPRQLIEDLSGLETLARKYMT